MGNELGRSIKLLDLLTGTDPRNRPFQNEREKEKERKKKLG